MSLKRLYEDVPSDALHYFRNYSDTDQFLRVTTSHYDPIFTPLFASTFASLGVTGSFFGIGLANALGAAVSAIATTAVSIGIQALLAPKPPKPEDGKIPTQQALPYRQWIVGRRRVSGALMFFEGKGAYLGIVHAIAGHKIKSFNRYWLHDDEVVIDGSGYVQKLYDARYNGDVIRIGTRVGNPTSSAYSFITSAFAGDNVYGSSYRGDGQASMGVLAKSVKAKFQNTIYPFGAPRASTEVDGALVWDPRDPAQDPEDPDTWQWSRNAALIMIWHQCFNEFGHNRDYTKAILPVLDMWIEEANVCDEDVPRAAGGTEKRYQCSGHDTTENDPKVGTNAILSACDGWICERGDGALLFTVGKFRESRVATLTEDDIAGFQLQDDVLFEDEVNRLIPTFTYPDTDYATSDVDYFEDVDAQLEAGRIYTKEADYTWCDQWRQARRLGKRDWLRLREKIKGTLYPRLSGINSVYARWVRLDCPNLIPDLDGEVIENRRSVLSILKGGFSMEFIKNPDNIDEWTPATDEGEQPPVPAAPNPAGLSAPVINTVVAKSSSGGVYLQVKIVDPDDDSLGIAIRYRIADDGGSPGSWVNKEFEDFSPSGGYVTLNTNQVPADEDLDVQAAVFDSKGNYSEYSATSSVFSTADPTPPASVTSVSKNTTTPGQVTISWTAPNDTRYAAANVYWNTVNDKATATFAGPSVFGAPNSVNNKTIALTPGLKYAWIASVNASGVEQTQANWTATGSFTVT